GKFYGLPGLRLGFAVAAAETAARLRRMLGEWPVSGPAITIGSAAYADRRWAERTRYRLAHAALRLDHALQNTGFEAIGGTSLFRLVRAADAQERFARLAARGILVRPFAEQPEWLRIGLPRPKYWVRLRKALEGLA